MAALCFSYKFMPILSISMCAAGRPRSIASPSVTPYYLSVGCFISASSANLFASEQVLANMEIVKVNQLCSFRNGHFVYMGELE